MSYGFLQETIKEQVRQATDIVDLVTSYGVHLTHKGREMLGLCPWHDDSRPSMHVNPERQTYKCWVCNKGGDVFSYVMETEGVTFPEALQILADRAHIELPKPQTGNKPHTFRNDNPGNIPSSEVNYSRKKDLYSAMEWGEQQYHHFLLDSSDAQVARDYLAQRGITQQSIQRFKIGFSPDLWTWLETRARSAEGAPSIKNLLDAGLLGLNSTSGKIYERFRNRVIFPIHDMQNHSVGIGGRILPGAPADSAKYVNTPETPIFLKNQLLYGLDLARSTMQKSRRAVVMEGYTDVIMAHQFGITDAVAALGTAVGMSHIKLLKRFVDVVYLVLDGDAAGQKRTNEVLEMFISENLDMRVLTLPDNQDPAEFLLDHGRDEFEKMLQEESVDALQHAFNFYTRGVDATNIHSSEKALEKILSIMAQTPQDHALKLGMTHFREVKMLQALAFRFCITEADVRHRLQEIRAELRQKTHFQHEFSRRKELDGAIQEQIIKIGPTDPFTRKKTLLEDVLETNSREERSEQNNLTSDNISHINSHGSQGMQNSPGTQKTPNKPENQDISATQDISLGTHSIPSEQNAWDELQLQDINDMLMDTAEPVSEEYFSARSQAHQQLPEMTSLESGENTEIRVTTGNTISLDNPVSSEVRPAGKVSGDNIHSESSHADSSDDAELHTVFSSLENLQDDAYYEAQNILPVDFLLTADEYDWGSFGRMDSWQTDFIMLLLHSPSCLTLAREQIAPGHLRYAPARALYQRMCELEDEGIIPDFQRLLTESESVQIKKWLVDLDSIQHLKCYTAPEDLMRTLLRRFIENELDNRMSRAGAFRRPDLDPDQKVEMLENLIRDAKARHGIY